MSEIKTLFNYGDIRPDHVDAAEEIAKFLEEQGLATQAEIIRSRFKVIEIPSYDINQSIFVQYCRKFGIAFGGQGSIVEGDEPNQMQYPMIAISGDIRRLDNFVEFIKSND
jgi:hypothetical protein